MTVTAAPPMTPADGADVRAAAARILAALEGAGGPVTVEPASWELYETLVKECAERHVRIDYDDGRMALMSPLPTHEFLKKAIARLVEATTEELDLPCLPLGSATWRRRAVRKGLEADECYYIQHEAHVRALKDLDAIDLDRDPPPDLAVEVDTTHHPVARPPIYAALGVNEVWRHDGDRLEFLKRSADGAYQRIGRSEALPVLTPEVVNDWLGKLRPGASHTEVYRAFRQWLRSLPEAK